MCFIPIAHFFPLILFLMSTEMTKNWCHKGIFLIPALTRMQINIKDLFITLCITFAHWVLEALISHMSIPCDKTIIFYPVTLTLEFDPYFENFIHANNFWTVSAKALIFNMSIPFDKTFSWVPFFFTLWPWP